MGPTIMSNMAECSHIFHFLPFAFERDWSIRLVDSGVFSRSRSLTRTNLLSLQTGVLMTLLIWTKIFGTTTTVLRTEECQSC